MTTVDNDWKATEAYTLFTLLAQTVNTMMGVDTKERIFEAYEEIAKNTSHANYIRSFVREEDKFLSHE